MFLGHILTYAIQRAHGQPHRSRRHNTRLSMSNHEPIVYCRCKTIVKDEEEEKGRQWKDNQLMFDVCKSREGNMRVRVEHGGFEFACSGRKVVRAECQCKWGSSLLPKRVTLPYHSHPTEPSLRPLHRRSTFTSRHHPCASQTNFIESGQPIVYAAAEQLRLYFLHRGSPGD